MDFGAALAETDGKFLRALKRRSGGTSSAPKKRRSEVKSEPVDQVSPVSRQLQENVPIKKERVDSHVESYAPSTVNSYTPTVKKEALDFEDLDLERLLDANMANHEPYVPQKVKRPPPPIKHEEYDPKRPTLDGAAIPVPVKTEPSTAPSKASSRSAPSKSSSRSHESTPQSDRSSHSSRDSDRHATSARQGGTSRDAERHPTSTREDGTSEKEDIERRARREKRKLEAKRLAAASRDCSADGPDQHTTDTTAAASASSSRSVAASSSSTSADRNSSLDDRLSQLFSSATRAASTRQEEDRPSAKAKEEEAARRHRKRKEHSLRQQEQELLRPSTGVNEKRLAVDPAKVATLASSALHGPSLDDVLNRLPNDEKALRRVRAMDQGGSSGGGDVLTNKALTGAKNHRTAMYSGKRRTVGAEISSLEALCIDVLASDLDNLTYLGLVPTCTVLPLLYKCTPSQLFTLEYYNPDFVDGDTGNTEKLWEGHTLHDFARQLPAEGESWRDLYVRLHDKRDNDLKALTEKITSKIKVSEPERSTKLAHIAGVKAVSGRLKSTAQIAKVVRLVPIEKPALETPVEATVLKQERAADRVRPGPIIANAGFSRPVQKPVAAPGMRKVMKLIKSRR